MPSREQAEEADFAAILEQYPLGGSWTVERGESGMNNTTRTVTAGGSERYMLRVYNNHRDAAIVELEHEILMALTEEGHFPLRVPVPVRNLRGSTVTEGPDGRLASLCVYIPGERPTAHRRAQLAALGRAAGELTAAFGRIRIGRQPVYDPYYRLGETYAELDGASFTGLAERSARLSALSDAFAGLQRERERAGGICEAARNLPPHWIHGDLVMNNAVAEGDAIVGVLDFEFAAMDIRAMELAVMLADLAQRKEGDPLLRMDVLCEGFGSRIKLADEEISLLPGLMKLRMLDVAFHFANRFGDGLDDDGVLAQIVGDSDRVCRLANERRAELMAVFCKHLRN